MKIKEKKLQGFFLFFLVVGAALIFRISNLNLIEFKADEAINLFLASRPIFGHPFPPGGTVSSIGLLNPPLLNYLLFPFTLISRNPKIISFFIALVNSLTIGFFFLLLKRYYRLTTALVTCLLFAFSPWAIIFSRKIWTQNLLAPFMIIILWSLHKLISEKKQIYWLPLIISQLFLFQLHQASLIFILIINLFLLIKKVKLHLGYISLGFFLGVIPTFPYLWYLAQNFNSNPSAFLVPKERFGSQYFPSIFFRPFQILSQGGFRFILGDDILDFGQRYPLIFQLRKVFYLEYLLFPLGFFIFWKKHPQLRLLSYSVVGLSVAYFLLHFEPFVHYFLVALPILFLFLGTGFSFLLNNSNRFLKSISLFVFLALIGVSIAFNSAFFNFLSEKQALKGDYGTVFAVTERNAKEILSEMKTDPNYEEILLSSYLPKNLIYGYLPVGKMIYPYQKVDLKLLEERLEKNPKDYRVQNELIAYYTAQPPTSETLEKLKQKSQVLPGYRLVWEEISGLFRQQKID